MPTNTGFQDEPDQPSTNYLEGSWLDPKSYLWVFVNTIAFAVATVTAACFAEVWQIDSLYPHSHGNRFLFLGTVVNSIVGITQEILLFRHLKRPMGSWTIVTTLAGTFAWWLMIALGVLGVLLHSLTQWTQGLAWVMLGAGAALCLGGPIGIGQYLLLRNRLHRASTWIGVIVRAQFLGWISGLVVAMPIMLGLRPVGESTVSSLPENLAAAIDTMGAVDQVAATQLQPSPHVLAVAFGTLAGGLALGLCYGILTAGKVKELWSPRKG